MPRTEGARADLDRPAGKLLGPREVASNVGQPAEVVVQRGEVLGVGVDRLEDRAGLLVGALGVGEPAGVLEGHAEVVQELRDLERFPAEPSGCEGGRALERGLRLDVAPAGAFGSAPWAEGLRHRSVAFGAAGERIRKVEGLGGQTLAQIQITVLGGIDRSVGKLEDATG